MEKNREPVASEEPRRCIVHDVPDDLLRLILLRLDSPLCLVRAARVCKRWRRVVSDRAFLRLAGSRHPPVVVGQFRSYGGVVYTFVPSSATTPPPIHHSSSSCPRELVRRLHDVTGAWPRWHVADCHGGLVLLREGFDLASRLVVCDPLSSSGRNRYRYIDHPPEHASRRMAWPPRVFLLDGGDDDDDGNMSMSNFRVLFCAAYYVSDDHDHPRVSRVYAFFSAADDGGDWRLVREAFDHDLYQRYTGHAIGRIGRSLYTAIGGSVRVLDNGAGGLEFADVDLPIRESKSSLYSISTFAVVHHGGGASPEAPAATASIVHVRGEDVEVFHRIPASSGGEWVLEHSILRLSEATRGLPGHDPDHSRWRGVQVIAGGTRLAMLRVSLSYRSWCFSVDVDTMKLHAVPDPATIDMRAIIYTLSWPQFLTPHAS